MTNGPKPPSEQTDVEGWARRAADELPKVESVAHLRERTPEDDVARLRNAARLRGAVDAALREGLSTTAEVMRGLSHWQQAHAPGLLPSEQLRRFVNARLDLLRYQGQLEGRPRTIAAGVGVSRARTWAP